MSAKDLEGEVRAVVLTAVARAFSDDGEYYAAVRHLASIAFLRWVSGVKNALIVQARAEHPDETYEQTAARLGTSVATINRAVTAHNRTTRVAS